MCVIIRKQKSQQNPTKPYRTTLGCLEAAAIQEGENAVVSCKLAEILFDSLWEFGKIPVDLSQSNLVLQMLWNTHALLCSHSHPYCHTSLSATLRLMSLTILKPWQVFIHQHSVSQLQKHTVSHRAIKDSKTEWQTSEGENTIPLRTTM